jgi:hypothetical protein
LNLAASGSPSVTLHSDIHGTSAARRGGEAVRRAGVGSAAVGGGGRRWAAVGGGGRRWAAVGGGGRRWAAVGGSWLLRRPRPTPVRPWQSGHQGDALLWNQRRCGGGAEAVLAGAEAVQRWCRGGAEVVPRGGGRCRGGAEAVQRRRRGGGAEAAQRRRGALELASWP